MQEALMGASTFSGPVQAGTVREGGSANVGKVLLTQIITISANSGASAVSGTAILPDNASIVDFIIDNEVVHNGTTSSSLTIGSAAAGTQYMSGLDVKTSAGRLTPTAHTAAQVTAMKNITSNTTIYATVTSVGGNASTGSTRITVRYIQN